MKHGPSSRTKVALFYLDRAVVGEMMVAASFPWPRPFKSIVIENFAVASAIFLLECGNFGRGANRRAPSTPIVHISSTRKPAEHESLFLSPSLRRYIYTDGDVVSGAREVKLDDRPSSPI